MSGLLCVHLTCPLSNEWFKRISIILNTFLLFSVDLVHYLSLKWLYHTPKPQLWLQTTRHVEILLLARNKVRLVENTIWKQFVFVKETFYCVLTVLESYFISVLFRYLVARLNCYYLCIYSAWLVWGYCWHVKNLCGIEQECYKYSHISFPSLPWCTTNTGSNGSVVF